LDDFVYWYNDVRFHESPDTKHYLKTPKDAFWSSLPVEAGSGVAFKLLMRWGMRGRFIKSKISGLHIFGNKLPLKNTATTRK